jgi:hypothetical protein
MPKQHERLTGTRRYLDVGGQPPGPARARQKHGQRDLSDRERHTSAARERPRQHERARRRSRNVQDMGS